jgi:hypothetical protein
MSLKNARIEPLFKLNLLEVVIDTPAPKEPPREPLAKVERPYTDEELAYSILLRSNPLIEELVKALDLVSFETSQPLRTVTQ